MKIAIDLGHGVSKDGGAVGIISEETIIRDVGNKVIEGLKSLGHDVLSVRPSSASSVTDSLSKRTESSNNFGADLFVSIHANAGGGNGSEVYTYGGKEMTQARNVLNNLVSLGFRDRGIKSEELYVINHTSADAMLVEICFVDTDSDVQLYNSLGSSVIAKAIVDGLTGVESVITQNEKPTTGPSNIAYSTHLKDWQLAYNNTTGLNITVDGFNGPETESAISNSIVKIGMSNSLVAWVQCRVGVVPDAIFGPITKQAVINFQTNNELIQDGVVGPITFKKLLNKYNW